MGPNAPPRLQFLLSVDEVEGVGKHAEPWRKDTSSPMVIEVEPSPCLPSCAGHGHGAGADSKALLQVFTQPSAAAPAPGSETGARAGLSS
jgi:hypothetical protein